jgi:hypothetical protein
VRDHGFNVSLRLLVGEPLSQSAGLLNRGRLRELHLLDVAGKCVGQLAANLAADQLPRRVDDLLLKLR